MCNVKTFHLENIKCNGLTMPEINDFLFYPITDT